MQACFIWRTIFRYRYPMKVALLTILMENPVDLISVIGYPPRTHWHERLGGRLSVVQIYSGHSRVCRYAGY